MGFSIGCDDLSSIGEFVQDVIYHAQRYSGVNKVERRKQTFQHRLRKLRVRERRERKLQGNHVSAPQKPRDTELSRYISELQPPLRPQRTISDYRWGSIAITWKFEAFKEDVGMRALFAEERNNDEVPPQVTGLFVQEFRNSPDALGTHIHRVFRPSNWQNPMLQPRLTEGRRHQAWVNMRPALTLATKFLLDPRFGAFWYHLMYGTPVTDAATRKTYLEHSNREDDLQTACADFEALLESLADRTTFYWRPEKSEGPTFAGVTQFSFWEILKDFIDSSRFDRLRKPVDSYNSYIGLSSKFLYNLMSENAVTYSDVNADIRLQFVLAVTITHELAHAIYGWRGLPHVDWTNGLVEVFAFDTDISNEIGWSWENHTWDGVILACTLDHDAIGEVRARTWESEILNETYIFTPVPEDWLKSLFMKDTWKNINQAIKKIPKPASSPWSSVKGDVDPWFKRVRKVDQQKASQTGRFVKRPQLGPRSEVLGQAIACVPIDGEYLEEEDNDDDDTVIYESSNDDFLHGEDPPEEYEKDFDIFPPPTFRLPGVIPVAQHRPPSLSPSPNDLDFPRGAIPSDRVRR